jgi:branched-chain amino acid transport system substrate-binding protein
LAAGPAGCLGDDDPGEGDRPIRGGTLIIYSSLPTEGPSAGTARAVAAGQRQALADAGERAGRYRVRLVTLSSSKPGGGHWDPGQVNENAEQAARDPRAIAYLGELNLGASAISVPVTNDADILQVSPGDGLTSLTARAPRAAAGPERYYPSGRRSFVQLVPNDLTSARLMLERLSALGARRPGLIVGSGVYARELAAGFTAAARSAGVQVVAAEELGDESGAVPDAVGELLEHGADAVALALARDPRTPPLLAELARRLPAGPQVAGNGLLVGQPLVSAPGPLPERLEAIAPAQPSGARARRVLERIRRTQGAELAVPAALWGYESMRVALDAIRSAQTHDRRAERADVIRAALTPRARRSPLGTYTIRRSGATDGLSMSLYRLEGDRFEPEARFSPR